MVVENKIKVDSDTRNSRRLNSPSVCLKTYDFRLFLENSLKAALFAAVPFATVFFLEICTQQQVFTWGNSHL